MIAIGLPYISFQFICRELDGKERRRVGSRYGRRAEEADSEGILGFGGSGWVDECPIAAQEGEERCHDGRDVLRW